MEVQWEAEKTTLLELLRQTQTMLKTAQDSAARDRDDQAEQYRLMELRLGSQLKLLKAENASLKQEVERLTSAQGMDAVSLKSFMLKEIEKVERRGRERETELLGQVESSKHETQMHRAQLELKTKAFADEREQAAKQVEAAKQETKMLHVHYSAQIHALKSDNEKVMGDLKRAWEDLKSCRTEIQSLRDSESTKLAQQQELAAKENEALTSEIENLKKALRRKDKQIASLSSASDSQKRAELTPLKAQIEALGSDKQALKQQLQLSAALYSKKERNLVEQVETWKKAMEHMKVRPASVQAVSEAEQGRLLSIVSALETDNKLIRVRLTELDVTAAELASIISGISPQDEPEISHQLDQLLSILSTPPAIPQFSAIESRLSQVAKAYETAIAETSEKAQVALQHTSEAMQDQIQLISAQHQDLVSLTAENLRLETLVEQLQTSVLAKAESKTVEELVIARLELEQAKKSVLAYLESIQSLEVIIENHTQDGEVSGDVEMELQRFNAEVTRIAQENSALTEAKRRAEGEFRAETARLREALESKAKEVAVLRAALMQEKKVSLDLVRTISGKLEVAVNTVEDANAMIQAELKQFLRGLPELSQLQRALSEAQNELLNTYGKELQSRSTALLSLIAQWEEDIAALRPRSEHCAALQVKLETEVKSLFALSSSLTSALEKVSELSEYLAGSRPRDSHTLRLETEVQSLQAQLAAKQQEFSEELRIVRTNAESEVKSLRQVESSLTGEIAALRKKLKELQSLSH